MTSDVRVIGPRSILRGLYELSKHSGTHAIVFQILRRMNGRAPQAKFGSAPPGRMPDATARRTLDAASVILAGEIEMFGRPIAWPCHPDWHDAVETAGRWPLID